MARPCDRCLSMQLSPFTHISFRTFPLQPYLSAPCSALTGGCHGNGSHFMQASPLTGRLATDRYRIEFTSVWDYSFAAGCFPPRLAATQFPFASPPEPGSVAFRFALTGLYGFMITPVAGHAGPQKLISNKSPAQLETTYLRS